MEILYEHHVAIKKDRLCPFKLGTAKATLPAPSNWHENIEILLVTGGSGFMQYGRNVLPLACTDISVVNSGVLHRPIGDGDFDYRFLIIDEHFCRENGLDVTAVSFRKHFRDEATQALFLRAAEAAKAYEKKPCPLFGARFRLSVLTLLVDLFERHAVPIAANDLPDTSSEHYVKKAMKYINEHYTEQIRLDTLASLCDISKCHLAREFKKITGQTVLAYIHTLRCKRAELLISEGKSVTEAAFDAGFESLSYFSRTYKKIMGGSPSKQGRPRK